MDKIQLIFIFAAGFLISRMIIKVRLPERLVYLLIGRQALSLSGILLYLVTIAALLSFFIPNTITVLAMLPILELLQRLFRRGERQIPGISTMLALSVIYGANIGGMGSVTATAANGIMVTFAELNRVPDAGALTFAGWLIWGIPLVALFSCLAWVVLVLAFRTWRFGSKHIALNFDARDIDHPHQRLTLYLAGGYFAVSFLLSLMIMQYPAHLAEILITTGVLTLLFILFIFLYPISTGAEGERSVLLTLPDCYSNLPTRGFLYVGLSILLPGILYFFNINELFSVWLQHILPGEAPQPVLFALLTLITSFSTEILSNTAVQLSMFLIIIPLAKSLAFSPLLGLLLVTLGCTSAFMSPIATGVNGLAFGGLKGVSLWRMLAAGFTMNVLGGTLVSGWIYFFVRPLFGLVP